MMREIGRIKFVQIQQESLKVGEKPNRRYQPDPLRQVEALRLTPRGIVGLTADGATIIDVHHMDHPRSRNNDNLNGISFGFLSSYGTMRGRFGPHLADGIAGENILIETVPDFSLEDIDTSLTIGTSDGQEICLCEIMVAAPCVEFSTFCLNGPGSPEPETLKDALQFLSEGLRGFYATLLGPQEMTIQPGDVIVLPG